MPEDEVCNLGYVSLLHSSAAIENGALSWFENSKNDFLKLERRKSF